MISLIITLIVLILFIIITIYSINSFLFSVVDKFVSKNENFENYNQHNPYNKIPSMDSCKKLDNISRNIVNTQTGTNIPLNPIYYNDHVGQLNIYKNTTNN